MIFYHIESKTSFFQDNETAAQPQEKVEEEVGGLDSNYEEDTYEDMEVKKWWGMNS